MKNTDSDFIRMPHDPLAKAQVLADEEHRTTDELVRDALQRYSETRRSSVALALTGNRWGYHNAPVEMYHGPPSTPAHHRRCRPTGSRELGSPLPKDPFLSTCRETISRGRS